MTLRHELPSVHQVIGVITPLGSWGLHTRQEGWMLGFHVKPWRLVGQQIQCLELRVTKPMDRDQIEVVKKAIVATSVLSFSIFDLSPTERGTYTATLESINTLTPEDAEMAAAAEELRRPVEIKTAYFGTLKLNRGVDLFEGEVEYAGRQVAFSIPAIAESTEVDARALALAENVWTSIQSLDHEAREFASAQLLELKNSSWPDENGDEDDLTHAQFQDRMSLQALYIGDEDDINFYYDDGDLFFGHSIDVSGTIDGFTEASISG